MPKVSLLIPVFNAERFLDECLHSAEWQTLRDIQIICVDDGSTDASWSILTAHAAADKRYVLLRNAENTGLSYSRNRALAVATGEYCLMLDADDFLAANAAEIAAHTLDTDNACDIAVMQLLLWHSPNAVEAFPVAQLPATMSGLEAFRLSLDWRLHGVYMARRGLQQSIKYDETCPFFSDDVTPRLHFLHSHKVKLTQAKYFYRQHTDSGSHVFDVRRFDYILSDMRLRYLLENETLVAKADKRRFETHCWRNWLAHYRMFVDHKNEFNVDECEKIDHILRTTYHAICPCRLDASERLNLSSFYVGNWNAQKAEEWVYRHLRPFWHAFKRVCIGLAV